jgi:uncharacterized lipoprotein
MKSVLRLGLTLTAAVSLAGCHAFTSRTNACHNKQPYMAATSAPPLRIPPGLDMPDTTNALHIPELKEPLPPPRKGKDPCLDESPPYKVVKPVPPQA